MTLHMPAAVRSDAAQVLAAQVLAALDGPPRLQRKQAPTNPPPSLPARRGCLCCPRRGGR